MSVIIGVDPHKASHTAVAGSSGIGKASEPRSQTLNGGQSKLLQPLVTSQPSRTCPAGTPASGWVTRLLESGLPSEPSR